MSFLLSHHEISPLNKQLLFSCCQLRVINSHYTDMMRAVNDHLPGHCTCKVFDVDVSSQANELFNLLGVSPDGGHVKGSLPSLIPLVDLVLLSRRGAAGDFLLHRGRLWGVTGSRVWTQTGREKHLIDAGSKSLSRVEITTWINVQGTGLSNDRETVFTENFKD